MWNTPLQGCVALSKLLYLSEPQASINTSATSQYFIKSPGLFQLLILLQLLTHFECRPLAWI